MKETGPTDPRARRSRAAILDAAVALMRAEGPPGVTHQRVAEQAGVNRATVYRHWPRPRDLVYDALSAVDTQVLHPQDKPMRGWLFDELARIGAELSDPLGTEMALALIERARRDDAAADLRDKLTEQTIEALRESAANDVSTRDLDPDILAAQLFGPLLYRILVQNRPVDCTLVARIVDSALSTIPAPSEPGS